MTTPHPLWLALIATLALTISACQGDSSVRGLPAENNAPEQSPEEKEASLVKERARVETEALKDVGKTCSIDKDCPLYLRCIESGCKVPPAVDGDSIPDAPVASFAGGAQFFMELALDDDQRSRGLMFRPRMSDAWSMLFVYPYDRNLSFWMKNTLIPLDMVFINDSSVVVGVSENAEPLTLTSRQVPGESRFVLEINAGLAARYGIKKGERVDFVRLDDEHTPSGLP